MPDATFTKMNMSKAPNADPICVTAPHQNSAEFDLCLQIPAIDIFT
jgi:hypothetical protein